MKGSILITESRRLDCCVINAHGHPDEKCQQADGCQAHGYGKINLHGLIKGMGDGIGIQER